MYFDYITVFKALYLWTSVRAGAHMRCVEASNIDASTQHLWAPPLTEVQRYNTVMWLKYSTEIGSFSTRDCHMYSNVTLKDDIQLLADLGVDTGQHLHVLFIYCTWVIS